MKSLGECAQLNYGAPRRRIRSNGVQMWELCNLQNRFFSLCSEIFLRLCRVSSSVGGVESSNNLLRHVSGVACWCTKPVAVACYRIEACSWVVVLTLLFLQWWRVWWFPQLVWLYWARGVWNYPQTWCRFDVVALPPPSLFPLAPSCQIGFVEVVWIRRMWVSVSGAIDLLDSLKVLSPEVDVPKILWRPSSNNGIADCGLLLVLPVLFLQGRGRLSLRLVPATDLLSPLIPPLRSFAAQLTSSPCFGSDLFLLARLSLKCCV
ncbi:hypothetical protein DY000_02024432 [Brassica cretica]|uniref:Uncharacterized protein n=1 Tax=Brassica cretica TaxID=69181 RepID=A0ABQ7E5Z8_BRACR|nr:hypothetical protein DY000_02024432 [Brassica cretica]